jgi:uncharacterized protein (DUF2235 family)
MKRIAICMDGTWQKLSQPRATNINLIARSVLLNAATPDGKPVNQFVIYTPGVGSTLGALKGRESLVGGFNTWLTETIGGVFGEGLEDAILETYLRLCFNYEPGDEIFIFGFSRGAYSARSLAGMIGKVGILRRRFAVLAGDAFKLYRDKNISPNDPVAVRFRTDYGKREGAGEGRHAADHRPKIAYLGIFDTVGQRGLPTLLGPISDLRNRKFRFHDLNLGTHVQSARHALAIDERRLAFPATPWENFNELNKSARNEGRADPYQQRWFPGGHGDVGGGSRSRLSAYPLNWVVEGAEAAGLIFDRSAESPLTLTLQSQGLTLAEPISTPTFLGYLNPINIPGKWREIAKKGDPVDRASCEAALHQSATLRTITKMKRPYNPPPLRPYKDALRELNAATLLMMTVIALVNTPPKRKKFLGLF